MRTVSFTDIRKATRIFLKSVEVAKLSSVI